MTAPKMNWRELLRMQLESTIKSDFTWMRASRRGWHMDAVMPGMKNDELIDIAISIDASGPLTIMLRDSWQKLKVSWIQFQLTNCIWSTFDTQGLQSCYL
jgi:hypothetical protein